MRISVTTENEEQFRASLESGRADLIYVDAAYTDPSDYRRLAEDAHDAGKLIGLRLPHIWRTEADTYFSEHLKELQAAGFDRWLFRNMESVLWFDQHGLLEGTLYVTDHSMYVTNSDAVREMLSLLPDGGEDLEQMTCPLELNAAELKEFAKKASIGFELTVYGRAPMMVSAQCLQKTTRGCRLQAGRKRDQKVQDPCSASETVLWLKDRKGALMPVKNSCRFCYNTIYNAVPTVLYDRIEEIRSISPASLRYEFTTESAEEIKMILNGEMPSSGAFTRGHFKKSVQ